MDQRTNNIRIDVDKYYFNTDGALINKSTLPAALQTRLPWWFGGKFDFDCNYRNVSNTQNPAPWYYIGSYNRSEIRFLFTGLNNFQSVMQNGDLSLLFTDSVINPSYYGLVVMSSQNSGLTGIIQNTEFHAMYFDLFSSNPDGDYITDLLFMEVSKFGVATEFDNMPIAMYYDPMTRPRNEKLQINRGFTMSKENLMGGYLSFGTDQYYIDLRRISY